MSGEEVEDVKNEEVAEIVNNEVIEETTENAPIENNEEEAEPKSNEVVEEAKPKAKAKATPKKLPRSVKVVELVECQACNKKMLPKSLRNTHPYYCKGQPTETLPVNRQKASYGSKVEEKLRKEIEAEMKAKYANKENDKNAQNVQNNHNDVIQYSEPIEVKTKAKPVKMEEVPRQLTASELLQQSYNEMKRLKQQERQEKINRLKLSMF